MGYSIMLDVAEMEKLDATVFDFPFYKDRSIRTRKNFMYSFDEAMKNFYEKGIIKNWHIKSLRSGLKVTIIVPNSHKQKHTVTQVFEFFEALFSEYYIEEKVTELYINLMEE